MPSVLLNGLYRNPACQTDSDPAPSNIKMSISRPHPGGYTPISQNGSLFCEYILLCTYELVFFTGGVMRPLIIAFFTLLLLVFTASAHGQAAETIKYKDGSYVGELKGYLCHT